MESFNYNHLFYFWSVARNGSVSRASAELHISQPTVSEQIGKLEAALGVTLFERAGRGIRLSNSGQILYGYADQIFRLGQEMREVVNGGTPAAMTRLSVGFSPSIPNVLAAKLLQPVQRDKNVQLLCSRERTESLLRRLALRQLDVVVCDSPSNSMANVRVFSHKLASTGVAFMASPKLRLRGKFPQLLDGVPFLMAEANTPLRSALEYWLEKSGVQPKVVGEFSDAGLMESFAQDGAGVIAIPSPIEREMQARFKFAVLGRTTAVKQAFYAITADRNPSNPLLAAILKRGLR